MLPARSPGWLVALFVTVLALPILGVSAYLTWEVQQSIAGAQSERAGLTHLAALNAFLRDASAYAHTVSCGRASSPVAATARARANADVEAIDAIAPVPASWTDARAAWLALPAVPTDAELDRAFAPLLASIVGASDRSGLTFDPDTLGIDLSDALAYRLPAALAQLQSAERTLCSIEGAPPLALRLDLRANQVLADKSASDAFADLTDAVGRAGPALDLRDLTATREEAERAAPAASAALQSFMLGQAQRPSSKKASTSIEAAVSSLDRLMVAIVPVFTQMLDERLANLGRQRMLRILPGAIGLIASIVVALLALRLVSEHAALVVAERTASEQERMALHDALTGVMNRRAFYAALQRAVSGGANHGAVCLFDLDNFKGVNDTFGHLAGDDVLTRLAQIIEASVRSTDAVARIGGDEFAVFMHPPVDRRGIERVLAKIIADMSVPMTHNGRTIASSVSVGAALIAGGSMDEINAALAQADAALYKAKANGRGSYAFVD